MSKADETINEIVNLFRDRILFREESLYPPAYIAETLRVGSGHEFLNDKGELDADLSLGGGWRRGSAGNEAYDAETKLRHLKRLLLLVDRVFLYKTSAQTRTIKAGISALNLTAARAKLAEFLRAHYDWERRPQLQSWLRHALNGHGRLVHFYDQSADPRVTARYPGGCCYGITVRWLISLSQGIRNFWSAFPVDKVFEAMEQQKTAVDRIAALNAAGTEVPAWAKDRRYIGPLVDAGFSMVRDHTTNPTPELLAQWIASGTGPYTIVSLLVPDAAGVNHSHSIAGWKGSDGIHLLDPNCGEMCFGTQADLEKFLPKLLRKMGYTLETVVYKLAYTPSPTTVPSPAAAPRLAAGSPAARVATAV